MLTVKNTLLTLAAIIATVVLINVAMVLMYLFPGIALWLPDVLFAN